MLVDLHTSLIERKGSGGRRNFQGVGSDFLKNDKWMQKKKDLALPNGEFSQISFFLQTILFGKNTCFCEKFYVNSLSIKL